MHAHITQLCQRLNETRAAINAKLTQMEQTVMTDVTPTPCPPPQPTLPRAADPPALGEPPGEMPPDSRPFPWQFGRLGATELARRVVAELQRVA